MKTKSIFYLLVFLCGFSCSEEENSLKSVESKTLEKVSSVTLKQQLLGYLNSTVKTRASCIELGTTYNFETQEIVRPPIQVANEEMIVVRDKTNANNIMAFYKENDIIENCLIIECLENTTEEFENRMFTCYDCDKTPIFRAIVDRKNDTCNVIEIYDGLENLLARGGSWGCNMSLGLAGAVWSTAFGMVTAGAGFAVAVGWGVLQTWLCSSNRIYRVPPPVKMDTVLLLTTENGTTKNR